MKKELLLTILLVLGIMAAPVKVIGQNLLPDISIYGEWTVEGTAGSGVSPGLKWRVYREDYSNLIMQAGSGSHTTVTKNWVITATNPTTRSVDMGMLREKVSVAELTCNEIATSYIGAIGEEAFLGFENLQMVYLPQKKTISIGANAFKDCAKLSNVSGMDYMINIGESAFEGTAIECSEIGTKATASGGNIGRWAFYGCDNITDLTIDRVSTIGADAFAFCSGMSSLTLGYGVSTIGNRAFNRCDNLREIHIGENVRSITNAFSSTLNYLDEITVSEQNTFYSSDGNCLIETSSNTLILGTNSTVIPNTVKYITLNAFNGRTNLSTINIPASVTNIYANAFYGCTNLKEVWCEAETPPSIQTTSFANISSNAVLYVPTIEAVATYGASTWNDYFSEIKIGKKEENGMIWGLIPNDAGKYTLWVKGIEELGDFSAEGGAPWSKDVDNIVAVDVKYGVKSIGSNAFSEFGTVDTGVTFSLPSSLVSIADNAFSGCKRLKSIELPNSLTTIGEGAFQECSALESVTLGSSVETIGAWAFNGTPISSITIPASVKSIGKWAFADCTALESVTFAEGSQLTSIGDNAFNYCNALESIAIPNSVTSIGESAFEMCYGLVSATLSNSMETIPNSMFYECMGLKNVTIPESITTIGNEAFSDCYALESITLPNSVTTVGDNVFAYCDDLESVTLSNSMETIPNSMFNSCTGLKNITIPESVTSIGEYAFSCCTALPEIIIPNTVTSIEEGAFYKCSGLKAITIGKSVESIGASAFSEINRTAVITWLPYEMPELNYEEFPRGIVWRVYYIPNYPNPYARVEAIPVTITDGAVDNYEDIYEKDILLSRMEYNRTLLADSKWNALYVPFEIPVADIIDKYDVAYINDVRLYDSDNDGEIDDNGMEVEVVPVKSGTLNANTPCLIRVKKSLSTEDAAAARSMNLALETKLCPAKEKTFDCSSIYKTFAFTGVYNKRVMDVDEDFTGAFAIATDGNWRASKSLKPFRIFLQITNRDGSPYQPTDASASIRIRVVGEDEEATGISSPEATTDNAEQVIYDLHGRRVKNPTKGIYIVNGKKTVIK